MKRFAILSIQVLWVLAACTSNENKDQLFELVDSQTSGITFINKITESDSVNVLEFMNVYTGGGVTVGDVNNDSLPDVFFSGNMVSSKLYINKSSKDKLVFEDVTERAGVATQQWISGVTMVDINQDGLLDIYACSTGSKVARRRENKLFINQGIKDGVPSFKEQAEEYGLNDSTYTTQAAFFDYDRDGDLDAFLIVNIAEDYYNNRMNRPFTKISKFDPLKSDRLYKNTYIERLNGDKSFKKQFVDVSEEAGIFEFGHSLGLSISDINNDGWPDIYIANDFVSNDVLYMNNQDGTFSSKAGEYLKHSSYAGMGVDIADFNNDQRTDIAVVDMIPEDNLRMKSMMNKTTFDRLMIELRNGYYPQFSRNTLQVNNGKTPNGALSFSEIAPLAGIHHTDWSWSVLFADYDNDGWKDIFITNGFLRDMQDLDFIKYVNTKSLTLNSLEENKKQFLKTVHQLPGAKVPNYIFRNQGNFSFQNKTESWGLSQPSYSNGAAYTDLDNDGDLDILVSNINHTPFVYKNLLSTKDKKSNHLKINFQGSPGNKHGIGARVELTSPAGTQTYENYLTRGFLSSISATLTIGLGDLKMVDTLKVLWPDGKQQLLKNVKSNTQLTLEYSHALEPQQPLADQQAKLFTEVHNPHQITYRHSEDNFMDFNSQRLIPFKLSQSGPSLAVGDMDGNNTDDLYVGGSGRSPGRLFKQQAGGTFQAQMLNEQNHHEDTGSLLFDADKDGDLDLYVVSGSVEVNYASSYYQDRLYVNDGKGNFTRVERALPEFTISGSCVTAADFDKDGDLDLFVGGRSLPGSYPLPTSSKVLLNNSKEKDKPLFVDATDSILPALTNIGMITAALWTDYNNDSWVDLMMVGEGMPITLFENLNGKFKKDPTIIVANSRGLWNSIVSADFDADGDMDYALGNKGLNSLLKASPEQPVRVYAKDFDRNGSIDPILCYYLQGKNVPFHPRDEFVEQIYIMRGIFTSYAKYASATIETIFSQEELAQAYVLTYETFASSYLQNNGKNGFVLTPLPVEAQVSSTFGMIAEDFDGDGICDLMTLGNNYAANIYLGWYDASTGTILKGKGDGSFVALDPQKTGFFVDKDAKASVEIISAQHEPLIVISKNSDSLQTYRYTHMYTASIPLQAMDAGAKLTYHNGKTIKKEFYYGSGYLSQSSRKLKISNQIKSAKIYDYFGNEREVALNKVYATQ